MNNDKLKLSKWDSNLTTLVPYSNANEVEHMVAHAYAIMFAKICVDTQSMVCWRGHKYPDKDNKRPNGVVIKAKSLEQEKNQISIHPLGYVEVTYNDRANLDIYLKRFNMMYVSKNGGNKIVMEDVGDDVSERIELVSKSKTKLFHKLVEEFSNAFNNVIDENPGRFTFASARFYEQSKVKPDVTIEI